MKRIGMIFGILLTVLSLNGCPGVIYFQDADGDGYGNPDISVEAIAQPGGYVANADDCDDSNANIHPGAEEICGDDIDNDCTDGDSGLCVDPIIIASDIESGLTNINVTWTPIQGATHYKLYMASDLDSEYQLIASNLTDTSYVFVEDWKTDVTGVVGEMPKRPPESNGLEKEAFINQLIAYREAALPLMHSFKSVKYFRFQACNEMACGPLSEPDAGQAEFVHTAAFSDISEMLTIMAGYPLLMFYIEPETQTWCMCEPSWPGAFGGEFVGYVDSESVVHSEYHDYTEGYLPSRIFTFSGEIGGKQNLILATQGVVNIKGDLTVTGAVEAQMHLWVFMGGTSGKPNQGTIDVTYKGATCQFPLPL